MVNESIRYLSFSKWSTRVEIDDSKIIANSDRILWIFDRFEKEAYVYCVMEDRTQNTLLDLVKENLFTINDDFGHDETLNTLIYSYLFASY